MTAIQQSNIALMLKAGFCIKQIAAETGVPEFEVVDEIARAKLIRRKLCRAT